MSSNTTDSSSGIEKSFKLFSLIYVFLITCGLTYNYFFYRGFGLYITEYIELDEALLMFLPLLANGFVIACAFIVLWHFMNRLVMFGVTEHPREVAEQINFRKQIRNIAIADFVVLGIILTMCSFHLWHIRVFYMMAVVSIVLFLSPVLELGFRFFEKVFKFKSSPGIRDIFFLFIVFLSIVIWLSYSKTERVYRRGDYKAFEIHFSDKDSILKGDSNIYLLGRTRNYLFLYDFKQEQSRVINVSDVKEFISSNK